MTDGRTVADSDDAFADGVDVDVLRSAVRLQAGQEGLVVDDELVREPDEVLQEMRMAVDAQRPFPATVERTLKRMVKVNFKFNILKPRVIWKNLKIFRARSPQDSERSEKPNKIKKEAETLLKKLTKALGLEERLQIQIEADFNRT